MDRNSQFKKFSKNKEFVKYFDRNVAYYQDELNFLWLVYGHEPNIKEVLNWRSWDREGADKK